MSQLKKLVAGVLAAAFVLTGCQVGSPSSSQPEAEPQDARPVLLAVSFGTSYNETRTLTIDAIEKELETAFPDYQLRRAFTSQIIIDKLAARDNLVIDNVTQAMDRLVADGVKEVIVQPTHVMSGFEYSDVLAEVAPYRDRFESLVVGLPLLTSDTDYNKVVAALAEEAAQYQDGETAVVFMGHGTEHDANQVYHTLQQRLTAAGLDNIFIGTVEAEPTLEEVVIAVGETPAKKVVLLPLMIVAGDHATNDMAGDEEDSWKTVFTEEGYEVNAILKGLGEYPAIRKMFAVHAQDAMNLARAEKLAKNPLTADRLAEGAYAIEVLSSSSMFRIVDAQLTVREGAMTCVITMSGQGYDRLYMGTGEEAPATGEGEGIIPAVKDAEGAVTFEVPVEALNKELDCAAWSIKNEKWYDRTLVFQSEKLPAEAIKG